MLTLKEFVLELTSNEHFRVYMPNRDCLGFESYLVPHSAPGVLYDFDNEVYWEELQNQKYKHAFWHKTECDDETKEFLEKYGDHKVFSIEISSCRDWKAEDETTAADPEPCFNVFIIPE